MIISSFNTGPQGKPIFASMAIAGVAIVIHWCYPNLNISFRENEEMKNPKIDDKTGTIQDQVICDTENTLGDGGTKEFLFPWEPNYVPKGSNNGKSRQPRNRSPQNYNLTKPPSIVAFDSSRGRHESRTTERSCAEELDFLASMTFAGGLRSPSCPCCV